MCCQTRVRPRTPLSKTHLIEFAATIFGIGQFGPLANEPNWPWIRSLPEEGSMVMARIDEGNQLLLNLRPGVHSVHDHQRTRLAASVCFEMAWRFAEKVDGEVWQMATVAQCRPAPDQPLLYLARFPDERFDWSKICPGFQAVILGGAS